eukprot:TRINITY_DN56709_c0_g1_i2.p1 TRINITY_DN56709_c0_g1~~TRINITY_DN56709_c0_g1_i2.p1  ORF type:complete len:103 (-),score=2.92 TRINITY_DN56709_c0_g1_i2:20-328(-)
MRPQMSKISPFCCGNGSIMQVASGCGRSVGITAYRTWMCTSALHRCAAQVSAKPAKKKMESEVHLLVAQPNGSSNSRGCRISSSRQFGPVLEAARMLDKHCI